MNPHMPTGRSLMAVLLIALLSVPAVGQDAGEDTHGYVGADGCKLCHKRASSGDQYGQWMGSAHARAFETLGTPEAAEIAAGLGLQGSPQELDECLRCHVTAHGVDASLLGKKFQVEEGVSCESCHGAGADYKKKSIMRDHDRAIAKGLMVSTEETCRSCHNPEGPRFTTFDFEEAWAQVLHPFPEDTGDDAGDDEDEDEEEG